MCNQVCDSSILPKLDFLVNELFSNTISQDICVKKLVDHVSSSVTIANEIVKKKSNHSSCSMSFLPFRNAQRPFWGRFLLLFSFEWTLRQVAVPWIFLSFFSDYCKRLCSEHVACCEDGTHLTESSGHPRCHPLLQRRWGRLSLCPRYPLHCNRRRHRHHCFPFGHHRRWSFLFLVCIWGMAGTLVFLHRSSECSSSGM